MNDSKTSKTFPALFLKLSVIIALSAFFVIINLVMNNHQAKEVPIIQDSSVSTYQIDSLTTSGNDVILDGWFFRLKEHMNIETNIDDSEDFNVFLEKADTETGTVIYEDGTPAESEDSFDVSKKIIGITSKVTPRTREDVNDYFKCEYDYSNCGFSAHFSASKIDLENGLYRVAFVLGEAASKRTVQTSTYIYKGKLYYTNPILSSKLDVEGTDLEEIVNNGIWLASRPDMHCDLYQYEWKLYWIVDDGFNFIDGGTYMQYQLYTTQFDRLPNYRTDNNWFWANIGSDFEAYEVIGTMNCGKYRVSVRDIPNGYSVASFETGYFADGNWIWRVNNIHPYYDFSSIPDPKEFGYLGDDVADWLKKAAK